MGKRSRFPFPAEEEPAIVKKPTLLLLFKCFGLPILKYELKCTTWYSTKAFCCNNRNRPLQDSDILLYRTLLVIYGTPYIKIPPPVVSNKDPKRKLSVINLNHIKTWWKGGKRNGEESDVKIWNDYKAFSPLTRVRLTGPKDLNPWKTKQKSFRLKSEKNGKIY